MRKIFSLIFVLLLLAPAAMWSIDYDFEPQVERMGLKPPRFNVRALFDNEYYLAFDQYFNDNFSLRSPLLLAKRWLDFRLFHMTEVSGIHVGTNGWLYNRQSIENYRKAACDHAPDIRRLALELQAIEKLVEATGRRFIFTVAPSKSTIYPEHVGFVPKNPACNRSQYDLLLEAIGTHPLKGFVKLEKLLQDGKIGHRLLYGKTSTHWNDLGARVAAEAIRAQINGDDGVKQRLEYNDRNENGGGDLARRMMGFFTAVEDVPLTHYGPLASPESYSAIVYGDGYIRKLVPYLRQIFSRFEVIRTDSIPSRQYGENWHASDFILLERAESALASMRLDIDRIFSTFEAEARIGGRYLLDLKNSVPGANISLNKNTEYLEIKSVGQRSSFKLPDVPASNDRIFKVLKLTVEALHPDTMTF